MLRRVSWKGGYFITLTCPRWSDAKLQDAFKQFRDGLQAWVKSDPIMYVVTEPHESGYNYIHLLLADVPVSPEVFADLWVRGRHRNVAARVEPIKGYGAIRYLAVKSLFQGRRQVQREPFGPWPSSDCLPLESIWPPELRDPEATVAGDPVLSGLIARFSRTSRGGPGRPVHQALLARAFLEAFLESGPKTSKELFDAVRQRDEFSIETLRLVARKLGIRPARMPGSYNRQWALPRYEALPMVG
jgi:hypothetical protein